ncbi:MULTISPECIES: DUF3802 family protein [Aliagarivorans]|uniref:DUF3802 family protein n=1 Tax=Aliagarivorans TaxID=882379 RepID=UPI000411D769|nr:MULTISPECIES: DUF3802 family protein [Aliagarivorans]
MVTDSDGYVDLINFLADNLAIFEKTQPHQNPLTVCDYVSEKLSESVMLVCRQHEHLESDHRFIVIREIDAIVNDLEQVLSSVWMKSPTQQQQQFIDEFVGLIKNMFDNELIALDPI